MSSDILINNEARWLPRELFNVGAGSEIGLTHAATAWEDADGRGVN